MYIWEQPIIDLYDEPAVSIHELGEFIWYQLLLMTNTGVFAWWWFVLKRKNIRNAFVFATAGWVIVRVILYTHRSLAEAGFNIAYIEVGSESTLVLVVALGVLTVLVFELKRGMIAANFIVFTLALLLVVPQILQTHFLDAMFIMIMPSIAIANWVGTSRPVRTVASGRSKIVASLALVASVAVAVLVSGVVPLMIVAPNWATGIGVDEIVILHLAAWTAPFIGSVAVYIVIKRIANDPISTEWASVAWLILNFMAAFWSSIINIELSGLANLGGTIFGIGVVLSIGIGALAVSVLIGSLLLGRGAVVRPLFAASIWLAVLYAMTPLLAYSEIPQILKVLYSFELALTLTMVFFITSRVFGPDSSKKVVASDS